MQFARIDDITLHYQVIGATAEKPVIVFASSLGTDFRIWRDVIVRLVGDFAIVTYDKRGHGLSDVGHAPYSIENHVDDLIALLDHLAVQNAIICGLSVGGLIAQGLYAKRPDLVRALILCDTAHKIGTADIWNARIATVEESGIESIADTVLERWFTPPFRSETNPAFTGYRNMLIRQPVAGYTGTCAAVRDADYTEAAARIAVPAICVVGDQDGSTPPDLVLELAKLIPRARYEVIRDAGHIPCVEQPEALTAVIRAFVDQTLNGEQPHG
ncbi:3-oxoadipate enol-lactonase [Phyllobacterium phragmitis]|uniref:3-oxoadipate enol-lactonase n=1 Tax=Phyllobacterium phragmitis TaxID=2670329 RepID=A0A2S9IVQ2_9HYPH|nr:3-oxoadipate enol-lactonase [Phyllobacterium phragmitis]PRD44604.1 3-oxoadipate enol-lactonase [Phyllobacterium phragmitis]